MHSTFLPLKVLNFGFWIKSFEPKVNDIWIVKKKIQRKGWTVVESIKSFAQGFLHAENYNAPHISKSLDHRSIIKNIHQLVYSVISFT